MESNSATRVHREREERSGRVLQQAHQDGAGLREQPGEGGGGLREEDRRAARGGHADLHEHQDQDGDGHPEPGEVLRGDEGAVPAQHREAGLQPEGAEGQEGGEPPRTRGPAEATAHPKREAEEPAGRVRPGRPDLQGEQQAADDRVQAHHPAVQGAAAEVQALREGGLGAVQPDPVDERGGGARAEGEDHQVRHRDPQPAAGHGLGRHSPGGGEGEGKRGRGRGGGERGDPAAGLRGQADGDPGHPDRGGGLHLRRQDEGRAGASRQRAEAAGEAGHPEEDPADRLHRRGEHLHRRNGQPVQVPEREGEARDRGGPTEEGTGGEGRGGEAEPEEAEGRRGEEGGEGGSGRGGGAAGGLEERLQGGLGAGGGLPGGLDEQQGGAEAHAGADRQEVPEAAVGAGEEGAHREGGQEVLGEADAGAARAHLPHLEGAGQVPDQVLRAAAGPAEAHRRDRRDAQPERGTQEPPQPVPADQP